MPENQFPVFHHGHILLLVLLRSRPKQECPRGQSAFLFLDNRDFPFRHFLERKRNDIGRLSFPLYSAFIFRISSSVINVTDTSGLPVSSSISAA